MVEKDVFKTSEKYRSLNDVSKEVKDTIQNEEKDKAAEYDGVDINMRKLLVENGPFLEILTLLINIA